MIKLILSKQNKFNKKKKIFKKISIMHLKKPWKKINIKSILDKIYKILEIHYNNWENQMLKQMIEEEDEMIIYIRFLISLFNLTKIKQKLQNYF